jgi:hypothetical protein
MGKSKGHCTHDYCSPEYNAWRAMFERCNNPRHKDYSRYGGRGISVCQRWIESFENFLADIGLRPSKQHSLDRFPNNETGDYEPSNCRWATREQQNANRRDNVFLEYKGERRHIREWAKIYGINVFTFWQRVVRNKWPIEKAINEPIRKSGRGVSVKPYFIPHSFGYIT